jgi:tetratricopeptide (TPR) repeat protein
MTDDANNEKIAKAEVFFARARDIANTSNFDYAIAMYIEGLRCEPDDVTNGHIPLRKLALLRQGRGGKKPSMKERIKRGREKDVLEQMLSAEYLLAKDPDHLPYAQAMLKAAVAAGYSNTAHWMADLLFQANAGSARPSVAIYVLLKEAYESIGQYNKAMVTIYQAAKLKPEDAELSDEYKRLCAELTVSRGKYDTNEDFRKAVKDSEQQKMLQAEDGVVKSDV